LAAGARREAATPGAVVADQPRVATVAAAAGRQGAAIPDRHAGERCPAVVAVAEQIGLAPATAAEESVPPLPVFPTSSPALPGVPPAPIGAADTSDAAGGRSGWVARPLAGAP